MSRILIIRFSALGDVAMTIPVIHSLATSYPMHEISVLSRQQFKPLFANLPDNVRFIGADLKGKHKGLSGINRLYIELKDEKFDYVADFHAVLRSNYLCSRFMLAGVPMVQINKGRIEKKKLTQKKNKLLIPLETSFSRYQQVLEKLGFHFDLHFESVFKDKKVDITQTMNLTGPKSDLKWLGIAPFAKHKGKIYPLELQEKVIAHFANDKRVKVFLFGGGENEKSTANKWIEKYTSILSLVGVLNTYQELEIMSQLDIMFSMDSANMHLASLVNTPVVSFWGATHPYAGFMGWNQSLENTIQTDLFCRPCSIYGQIPCYRKNYECLYKITPDQIIDRIDNVLFNPSKISKVTSHLVI